MVWSQHNPVWIQDRLTLWMNTAGRVPLVGIVHWDDIERHRAAKGEMDATWQQLAKPAGAVGIGVNRMRNFVFLGRLPTPPHSHGASEEIYYVLGGAGLAWQDEQAHQVRAGDCVIHRADEMEHTFIPRPAPTGSTAWCSAPATPPSSAGCRAQAPCGSDGPGSRAAWTTPGTSRRRGRRSRSASPPRPPNIINIDEAERDVTTAVLLRAAGNRRALGAGRLLLGSGCSRRDSGSPPHCRTPRRRRRS